MHGLEKTNFIELSKPSDPTVQPKPIWVPKDYVTEAWPEVKEKAAQLQAAADELLASINSIT